jgi:SAM-dependent methyltransferase
MPDKEEIELDIGFSYFGDPDIGGEYGEGDSLNVQPGPRKKVIGIDLETTPQDIPIDQITASADYLPIQDESVDSIFAGGVYGAYVDLEDSVKEADRVLRPGGKIFIRTWGRYMPRLKLLLRRGYYITEMIAPDAEFHRQHNTLENPLDFEWHVRATKRGKRR